jgi:acyl-coenzyme A synthetase/AMP-(fatty) acid ligase
MDQYTMDRRLTDLTHRLVAGPAFPDTFYYRSALAYADLYGLAANILDRLGNETVVCLCTHDKAVVTAAMLAALAGGPQVILPYALTHRVLAEIQSLTGYEYAVTDETGQLPDGIRAFSPRADTIAWPPGGPVAPIALDAPWIHLFTGGSTGTPVSWLKTVRNLLAETVRIVDTYDITSDDCLVSTVSPLHIYGLLYEILAALVSLACVTPHTPSFPAEIEKGILDYRATVLISIPAHYRALKAHPGAVFPLRLAFSSAGLLAGEDAEVFSTRHNIGITEVYGSTETGGVASRVRFAGERDFSPFAPVDTKLVEENLWVRSCYLSPGLPLDSDGFYHIGDRAAFTSHGRFTLMGRSDTVVKVGGKRVDLEAVREILLRHERVADALVTALPMGRAREQMIVAVVEGALESGDLAPLMAHSLEPYARPRRIKVVEKIPVTAAGKHDRRMIEEYFKDDVSSE